MTAPTSSPSTVERAPAPSSTAAAAAPGASTSAQVAITRRAFRQLWVQALVVGVVFGATAASSALSYASTYPTDASRQQLVTSFTGGGGFTMLFGQIDGIGTVGGYTVYKTYVFLTTIGAIWAALATTRLLRGEEDSERWHLVLAGRTTPVRATVATMAALLGGIVVVFVGTAVLTVLTGLSSDVSFSVGDSVFYTLSMTVAPLVFAAVAVVCSQLAQTRRLATGLSMGVFAVFFVLRMLGDASPDTSWMLWLTPLGWIELMKPFTGTDWWPLLPWVALVAACAVVGVALAGRRDAGSGAIVSRETSKVRPFGLGSPFGLACRLNMPVLVAWLVGVVATAFIMGTVAKAASGFLGASDGVTTTLSNLGAGGSGALQFLGVVFLLVGAVLALVPASQVGAARDEEATARLSVLLAGRASRPGWLLGRVLLAAVAIAVMGLLSGVAAWAGARSQGIEVAFGPVLTAGVNIVPAAWLALAIGMLVLAVAPRWGAAAVYLVVGWSLIVDMLGSLVTSLNALTKVTLFHYVTLAPADDPDWAALAVITGLALVFTVAAVLLFVRRDLAPD